MILAERQTSDNPPSQGAHRGKRPKSPCAIMRHKPEAPAKAFAGASGLCRMIAHGHIDPRCLQGLERSIQCILRTSVGWNLVEDITSKIARRLPARCDY